MLIQIHHQWLDYKNGHRFEFVGQQDVNNKKEMNKFMDETKANFPLPEDAQWYICNEKDSQFIMMAEEETNDRTNNTKRRPQSPSEDQGAD